MVYINAHMLARVLSEKGLLPPDCTLLQFEIGLEGTATIRYERRIPLEEMAVFGEALTEAAYRSSEVIRRSDGSRLNVVPSSDLTP